MTLRPALALALLWATTGGPVMAAEPRTVAQVSVAPTIVGPSGPFSETQINSGASFVSGSAGSGALGEFFSSFGQGVADASYGTISLFGSFAGSGATVAAGSFRDTVRLTVAGVPDGTIASVTYGVFLDGDLNVSPWPGSASAGVELQTDLGGLGFDITRQATLYNDSPAYGGFQRLEGSGFGGSSTTVDVVLGADLPLEVSLRGNAQARFGTGDYAGVPGQAEFNLAQTLYWAGILDVSVGGQSIAGYDLQSASGTDYRLSFVPVSPPVPEPGTLGLLLAGLVALVGGRRLGGTRRAA